MNIFNNSAVVGIVGSCVLLLPGCANYGQQNEEMVQTKSLVAEVDCSDSGLYQPLQQPPTLSGSDLIDTDLKAETVTKCVNGESYELMSYLDANAGIDNRAVGPTYILDVNESQSGPVLKINFSNFLNDTSKTYDCGHHSEDVVYCTNLHTHGFHVSPKGSDDLSQVQSDYVLVHIPPREDAVRYQFDIPNSHAPGTHWLHAHVHGSTSPQVRNGMAGALVLKGELDQVLEEQYGIGGDKDRIMILQQMEDLETSAALCGTNPDNGETITTSINGQCLPVINVNAGDVERWRFIHAGISATVNLALVNEQGSKIPLHEFARDGITMNGYQTQNNVTMQPGYRSDILVELPQCNSGDSCIWYLIDDASAAKVSLYGVNEPENQIAKVVVGSGGTLASLPPASVFTNPYPFVCDPENFTSCSDQLAVQNVWFSNAPKADCSTNPGTYKTVNRGEPNPNGGTYSGVYPDNSTKELQLGGKNTWKLWVGDDQCPNGPNHPFHIHVNPFQVYDQTTGFSYWKDTLLVSASDNQGEDNALTVVSEYQQFDGPFVLHCHNLNHEDDGMMMGVVINP